MNHLLFLVFALLQILDWQLTRRLLGSGLGREANPIAAFFIRCAGIDLGILTPKAVAVILVYLFVRTYAILLFLLCVVYAGIVAWNYQLMRKAQA